MSKQNIGNRTPLSDGWKKEIYRDVWFFHGALQLLTFMYFIASLRLPLILDILHLVLVYNLISNRIIYVLVFSSGIFAFLWPFACALDLSLETHDLVYITSTTHTLRFNGHFSS